MRLHRITALLTRHLYLYRRSFPRMLEIVYWPFVDLVVWGFITLYLEQYKGTLPSFVTFFLGALILWDVLFRAQQGITISFLEEIWSRNLMNLFASPLTPGEFLAATMLLSVAKVLAVSCVTVLAALAFYSFNVFVLGASLIPFILNLLVVGWCIGVLTTGLIMRYGQEVEVLAWGLVFLFQPISCVFYPMSILPAWLQAIANINPAAHVFEGMRTVITTGTFPAQELAWAVGLNALYLFVLIAWFHLMFAACKDKGLLVRVGE
jgi:ABC-2 type transport system permease protein